MTQVSGNMTQVSGDMTSGVMTLGRLVRLLLKQLKKYKWRALMVGE